MSCNCRGGQFCCMQVKLPYDTDPFHNFDEYYKPVNFEAQKRARNALEKVRAKRKKNLKGGDGRFQISESQ